MIHAVFDLRRLGPEPTGVGLYAQSLYEGLLGAADVFVSPLVAPQSPVDDPAALRAPISPEAHPLSELWETTRLPSILRRKNCEIFHAPAFHLPRLPRGTAGVVTCHDLAVFRYPGSFPRRFVWYLRRVIRRSIARADRIVVDTEAVGRELTQRLRVDPARIAIVSCGTPELPPVPSADQARDLLARAGVRPPYVLHVGTISARKNLIPLANAVEGLRRRGWDGQLVLAGALGYRGGRLLDAICQCCPHTQHLGYVSRLLLATLYHHAEVVAFPSLYEGFGLPLLEAFSMNAAVIASDIPSTREVGGDAVALFPPSNGERLTEVLWGLLRNEAHRRELAARGAARALRFTWSRSVDALVDLYKSMQ